MVFRRRRFRRRFVRRRPVFRRRFFRRTRTRRSRISSIKYGMFMPDVYNCKLKYSFLSNPLSTISDDFNAVFFKMNSIVDCGYGKSANSAMGASNIGNQYLNFYVKGSAIKVSVVNSDSDVPLRIGVFPTLLPEGSVLPANDNNLIGNPYCKTVMIGNATGMDTKVIRNYISTRKFEGRKLIGNQTTSFVGVAPTSVSTGVDPGSLINWIITAQALSNVGDNIDCILAIEIVYYVQFMVRYTVT